MLKPPTLATISDLENGTRMIPKDKMLQLTYQSRQCVAVKCVGNIPMLAVNSYLDITGTKDVADKELELQ